MKNCQAFKWLWPASLRHRLVKHMRSTKKLGHTSLQLDITIIGKKEAIFSIYNYLFLIRIFLKLCPTVKALLQLY